MRRLSSAALLVAAALAAGPGCGLSGSRPEIRRYMLVTAPAPTLPSDLRLELRTVGGSAPFHDTGIAYQTSPYRLDSYRFHRWVAPPTEMVSESLGDLTRQPGVSAAPAASDPVMLLDARIKAFQQVQEGGKSSGLVEIEFCLTPNEPLARPRWCQTLRRQTAASADTPEAAAEAISTSFSQVISELAAGLAREARANAKP